MPKPTSSPPEPGVAVRVWDLGIRLFHWALVASVSVSLLTGFLVPVTSLGLHLVSGSVIAALLGFRIVWGLLGSGPARFRSFAYPPPAVLGHLRDLAAGRAPRFLGHNPLGSMMVFALLLVLGAIVGTGLVALGGVVKQGPLAAFLSFAAGRQSLEIHQALAILLAVLIAAHLGGVIFETRRTGENLAGAMVTGRKDAAETVDAPPAAMPRTRLAAALVVGGTAAVSAGVAALAALPARGVPPATLDPTYELQCGACHLAYPPSIAPAATWAGILDDLKHHFGRADASLSPELAAQIRDYLMANAAEHWDTLPAHRLIGPDPADPLRLSATAGWRHFHAGIPDAVFAKKPVGWKGACDACHHDATTGRFAPQAIKVPAPRE